jgi:hypothetical protein
MLLLSARFELSSTQTQRNNSLDHIMVQVKLVVTCTPSLADYQIPESLLLDSQGYNVVKIADRQ